MIALAALLALALPGSEVVREWLVIPPTDRAGRRPFAPSAVFERHLLAPGLAPPKAGDALTGELGEAKTWAEQNAGEDGSLGGEIGWAYARVESAEARVVMAKLSGASRLFVGGTGYVGDAYAYGFGGVPVTLKKGANDVYVGGVRGSFRLKLVDVAGPIVVGSWDHLVPDLVPGATEERTSVGMLLWNATGSEIEVGLVGVSGVATGTTEPYKFARRIAAGAASRLPVPLAAVPSDAKVGTTPLVVSISTPTSSFDEKVDVPVRSPGEARRVGFVSEIDGSLQAYALVPRKASGEPVLVQVLLSLHGASVDALGQARSYAPKDTISIVCPTNRRPYGFDWQDWGRLDAYEALDHFLGRTRTAFLAENRMDESKLEKWDPVRFRSRADIVLTGHSMGGHGTWSLAANDPDCFDAIGPSAGWASFDSYGGRPDGALKALWHGADFASKTEELAPNLVPLPTFVLHGTADDNVPASEAHDMIARLEKLGGHPLSHFQEGAGHWWDGDLSAGADCVDYPAILALFDAHPKIDPYAFDWIGADPGVDSRHRWIEVLQPLVYGRPFRVTARRSVPVGTIEIETDNVRALRFDDVRRLGLRASVDGRSTGKTWPSDETWELTAAGWGRHDGGPLAGKSPQRCGPFKRAFGRRFVLVHGTSGDADEDRELFERARHDQQVWWYRANGTAEIVADTRFLAGDYAGRNVILYGNRDTNAAWKTLVPEGGPFDARRGELRVGTRTWKGDDLGAVCVRPRADDASALVGMFADTGPRGSRLGYVLAPFVSGVGYPDYAAFSSAILRAGDGGVLAAGWFDRDWNFDAKQYAKPE